MTKDDGGILYLNGEYNISVCTRDTTFEDFLVKVETICQLQRINFSLRCVVDESPPLVVASEADYALMMSSITSSTNVICVWVIINQNQVQKEKGVQRNLFPPLHNDSDWANQPNYSSFSTPERLLPLPSQYLLSPLSTRKSDDPMNIKGKGVVSNPLILETPPPVKSREDVYIPQFFTSPLNENLVESSNMAATKTHLSSRNDFEEVAGILDEMQMDKGYLDQYQSQLVQEDQYAVPLDKDEDSEATLWDSEVDVLDSPKTPWDTDDELSQEIISDTNDMFPELDTQEEQLEAEMYQDTQPMFGSFSTPREDSDITPTNTYDNTTDITGTPEINNLNPEDISGTPEANNLTPKDTSSIPANENAHPAGIFVNVEGTQQQNNEPIRRETLEVKRELFNIFSNLYNKPNVGCAPHTEPLRVGYQEPCRGQVYGCRDDLVRDIKSYAIKKMFSFGRNKTCKEKVIRHCKHPNCLFYLYATPKDDGLWVIKNMIEHTCEEFNVGTQNPQADSDWVAQMCLKKLRDNHDFSPAQLRNHIRDEKKTEITYKVAWMAKNKALEILRGSYSQSYQMLELYCKELKKVDPDSCIDTVIDAENHFVSFFWTYGMTIRAYRNTMRRVIMVDGTFLKGRYPGILLSAVSVDGNNHVFPIAFALVPKENNEYWEYFLTKLGEHVLGMDHTFVLISNRHKSIIQSVPKIFPNASHMYCAQHLAMRYGNKKVQSLVKAAAGCLIQSEFWGFMLQIWAISKTAYNKLLEVGPVEKWASAFSRQSRYGMIYTNHIESWNKMIIPERMLPVTSLVDGIRNNIIKHFLMYHTDASKLQTSVTKWCHELLLHNRHIGRSFTYRKASDTAWTVFSDQRSCVVDLKWRSCTCNWFQTMGIPCEHAIICIEASDMNPYEFCDVHYKKETYMETYKEEWVPTRGKEAWVSDAPPRIILPPVHVKQAGRPKVVRKRSKHEGVPVQTRRCSRCRGRGHNKATCTVVIDDFSYYNLPFPNDGPPPASPQ